MNTNFKVIDLTQPGIKPEADALTTRPSELFNAERQARKP